MAALNRAGVAAPVTANVSSVETPLLLHPSGSGAIVSLIDFRCSAEFSIPKCADTPMRPTPIAVRLHIAIPFTPTSVRSTQLGALQFSVVDEGGVGQRSVVVLEVTLLHADMLVLTK